MPYTYDYPRPMVTVDIFLLRLHNSRLEVLLIRRRNDPFKDKWALPGGYVEIDEPLPAAAERELREETAISGVPLLKLDVFGDPRRDPRGRTITVVYFGAVPCESSESANADDDAADVQWFPLSRLPDLAFDHDHIINCCYARFKSNLLLRFWALLFMEEEFSVEQFHSFLSNVTGCGLSLEKVGVLLATLPFLEKKGGNVFMKRITDEVLLKMGDEDVAEIWNRILG